MAGTGPA